MTERLVVIGGDAAGMSAASQARRRRGPDDLEIVAFERGDYTSYSACGIPYFVSDTVEDLDELIVRAPEVFRRDHAIEVHVRSEVREIDLDARSVTVLNLEEGRERKEGFDLLMIATGAVPLRPPLDGDDAAGILGVQTLNDGILVREFLADEEPQRAVVVGGGYIGLEMAEALVVQGLEVSLVEVDGQPMASLDPDMGELIAQAMRDMDIDVYTNERVTGFEEDARGRVSAVVTEKRRLDADVVILGLGARPNVELAQNAGIEIGPSGAIVVDQQLQTNAEGVWAAGDCAEKFHLVSRQPVYVALGTHANKEGRVAGINIGGGYATFPGIVGTAATKVCDLEVALTGLNEREAADAGFDYLTSTIDSTTRAGYFPGSQPIRTKLIVEKTSGRLLGAQIIGKEAAGKRIDALAVALWNEMSVSEMLNMDLSYAPPFAPVWDPVLIAARKAWERVEESVAEER